MLFRKPPPDRIHSSTYELGPKALEDVFEATRVELANMVKAKPTNKHNLTRQERKSLRELIDNDKIIINKADKGSTVVVRNKHDYID